VHGGRDLGINFKNRARKSRNFGINFNAPRSSLQRRRSFKAHICRGSWRRKLTLATIKFKLYRRGANFKTPAFRRRGLVRLQNLKLAAGTRLPRLSHKSKNPNALCLRAAVPLKILTTRVQILSPGRCVATPIKI